MERGRIKKGEVLTRHIVFGFIDAGIFFAGATVSRMGIVGLAVGIVRRIASYAGIRIRSLADRMPTA